MRLHVGTSALLGDIRQYASRFDLLELSAERGKLPKLQRLRELRAAVSPEFVVSLLLPKAIAALEAGEAMEQALVQLRESADAVRADWLVLRTEPSVMPSARTRRRLAEVVGHLPRDRRLAWEPRGLWDDEDAQAVAAELGVVLVRDVAREAPPPGEVLYTRLRALGRSGVSTTAIDRLAEVVFDYELAYVVLEGDGAARAAKNLRQLVTSLAADAAAYEDSDAEDEDEAEDELDDDEELDEDEELDDELDEDD